MPPQICAYIGDVYNNFNGQIYLIFMGLIIKISCEIFLFKLARVFHFESTIMYRISNSIAGNLALPNLKYLFWKSTIYHVNSTFLPFFFWSVKTVIPVCRTDFWSFILDMLLLYLKWFYGMKNLINFTW